jgi:hypothetical protein
LKLAFTDVVAALDLVRDMKHFRALLARLNGAVAERALIRLREMLAAHQTASGVLFESRAWLVTAAARERSQGY